MRMVVAVGALLLWISAGQAADPWIVRDSSHSVSQTADRLAAAVEAAGAKVFATVDHAAGAKAVGDELAPTVLVIFGNPKIGTPIIKADRRAGLDLPLRVLIWEEDGATRVGYEDPENLKARYGIEADESFAAMKNALEKLTTAASQ